jgi:GDP/UDP-N,N'-diacetylbacillosamine 2-epimerase (hydrolysing)
LTEVPSFRKGTINIGDRQQGRLKADSVIDCAPDRRAISTAIAHLYSSAFQQKLHTVRNPYGDGGASSRVLEILANTALEGIIKKRFFDL